MKRKNQIEKLANQKLGMMRHLFILLDCSEYMTSPDLKPTRFLCTLKVGNKNLKFIYKMCGLGGVFF